MTDLFSPPEAALATGVSLPLVQKSITSKQLPTAGAGSPRRLSRAAVLAISLSRRLPRGSRMTLVEAHNHLLALGDEQLRDTGLHLVFAASRIDLGDVVSKLDQVTKGGQLVVRQAGARIVRGLGADADDLLGRLQAGETPADLAQEYPGLDPASISAIGLWVEANPPRGRPRVARDLVAATPRDLGAWTRTMQITARQIQEWAAGRAAPGALPRLVRRLTMPAGAVTALTMPGGDSIALSGWDGELESTSATPWLPAGRSFWELSCEASVTTKANTDYAKRTEQTPETVRTNAALVVVTARRWSQKAKWVAKKRAQAEWADVRVLDADDLEAWLEQTPAVALWFADELGLTGPGVESPRRYWDSWANQVNPHITHDALFADRDRGRKTLVEKINQQVAGAGGRPIGLKADSAEEAAAFACAAVLAEPELSAVCLVVTEEAGWRFIDQNPLLKVVIVARPELAERSSQRTDLAVIVPYAAGDLQSNRGDAAEVMLERPLARDFEQALCDMGVDQADAKRWTGNVGRSWSVYRRRYATNPAIRRPAWLEAPQADALSVVCLLGAWSSDHQADQEVVAQIANRPYEDVERDLLKLARLDDSPILKIGSVWKAKAPLELLDLFGERFTTGELTRFFKTAKTILTESDPQLELADEDRHAAQIYGKVRPQSGILIEALCDTLMKLAVRGPAFTALEDHQIEGRVVSLVRELLDGADGRRWLSLASLLPQLAEAAPDAFLRAVETSLQAPGKPVTQLIAETSGGGMTGRCWHSGLLWALETLAWDPARLSRVAFILAQLVDVPISGNWGNTPGASLGSLFRTWLPQTAASLKQRIDVLDALIERYPVVAYRLLNELVNTGHDTATPSSRPAWRDDDAGAGHGVSGQEMYGMLTAAADRMIAMAAGHAGRIAVLLDKIHDFDEPRIKATLDMILPFTDAAAVDTDRETIREALRTKIHWLRNYGDTGKNSFKGIKRLDALYQALEPADVVLRHTWLFAEGWPRPPFRIRDDLFEGQSGRLQMLRVAALREVMADRGFAGVAALAASARGMMIVGSVLAALPPDLTALADWMLVEGGEFSPADPLTPTFSGVLRALPLADSLDVIGQVIDQGLSLGWAPERLARFLTLAPDGRPIWGVVEALGAPFEEAFWRYANPWLSPRDSDDFGFAVRRLARAGRPRTALQLCHSSFATIEPGLLMDLLEGFLRDDEPSGQLLSSWDIANAVDALEAGPAADSERLARLEFGLLRLLGYGGERKAKTLYGAVMTQPALFAELVALVYRPHRAEDSGPAVDHDPHVAQTAWSLLRNSPALPGQTVGGPIEAKKVTQFIQEARELCRQSDRLQVCDITLGGITARAPAGADGIWPHEALRQTLDLPQHEDIRRGLHTGMINKRGVTSRAYYDGGAQERGLAEHYQRHATALQNAYPLLAAALQAMVAFYAQDARREDTGAKLRIEGY